MSMAKLPQNTAELDFSLLLLHSEIILGNMAPLQANASGGTSEVSKARDAMIERGQKLNEIEDQVENMSNEAKVYAQNCQALKNHYKNKKWWQI